MTPRDLHIEAFLAAGDWRGAVRLKLAGDASTRRYERLVLGTRTAVLMDAPPDKGNDVTPFLRMAEHLVAAGLSAPRILDLDAERGLVILEDLGDDLFARLMEADPSREAALYGPAVDLIAEVAAGPVPAHLPETRPDYALLTLPLFNWYQLGANGGIDGREAYHAAFAAAVAALPDWPDALNLRDYHAENLLWLPERSGLAAVGLLDFQDACRGPAVYDLVSLLTDVRRDVSPEADAAMRARFLRRCAMDADSFDAACAVFSAQRNLRILGIFARLSMHFGKPRYIDLIPRVWRHASRALAHPALADVAATLRHLPEPTPAVLSRLKAQCGTHPHP